MKACGYASATGNANTGHSKCFALKKEGLAVQALSFSAPAEEPIILVFWAFKCHVYLIHKYLLFVFPCKSKN